MKYQFTLVVTEQGCDIVLSSDGLNIWLVSTGKLLCTGVPKL